MHHDGAVDMNDNHWGFWRSVLSETAAQILKHYGMSLCDPARWTPLLTDGDHVVGSVYFGGAQVRGGLTLCAPRTFLDTANPVGAPIQMADFARELTNQILGGVKSRVAKYGIDFSYTFEDPAPPEGLSGADTRTLVLRSQDGEVALMFAVSSDITVDLDEYSPSSEQPTLGKVILF
jgi:hypothetical protein